LAWVSRPPVHHRRLLVMGASPATRHKPCRIARKPVRFPCFSPELTNWLQSGFMGAGLAIVWAEVRAQGKRIDEQGKRIDELRADIKEIRAEQREDNRALNEKLDRLVEALLTARQP